MSKWPKGSEWRRWDLHIHTPETVLNDRYTDWGEFETALATASDVRAIGVTDYLGVSNYRRVRDLHAAGKLPGIELVVPNIEFRVLPPTKKHPGANIHLLIDPTPGDHLDQIGQALSHLTFRYSGNPYGCSTDQLRSLGRAIHGGTLSDDAALRRGVEAFRPSHAEFAAWLEGERWLRDHSLVGVVAGADGLSGWPTEGALAVVREEVSRLAHFIFSGREGEIDFWLLRTPGMDHEWAKKLGAPKPCLHGSDAHSMQKLFKPDQERYCWIKADPTFAGLRQVVFEPELRVHIGVEPPGPVDPGRVIDSIEIDDPNGWFVTERIDFNAGLVAIIGQKGSGKSALAELIASLCGAWRREDRAFLHRAGRELDGLSVRLRWLNGDGFEWKVGGEGNSGYPAAKYLSQSFVERLCGGEDIASEDLIHEIETVIFESLPESDRLGHGSFAELREDRTIDAVEAAQAARLRLSGLIAEELGLLESLRQLPEKEERLRALSKEKSDLSSQLPTAAAGPRGQAVAKLQAAQQRLAKLEAEEATDKRALLTLKNVRARLRSFQRDMDNFAEEITKQAKAAGIPAAAMAVFRPAFPGDYEPPLKARDSELRGRIEARQGENAPERANGTIAALRREIEDLEQRVAEDKAQRVKLVQQTERISEIDKETGRLRSEIESIRGPQTARLGLVRSARSEAYRELWSAIGAEKEALQELYSFVDIDKDVLEFLVDTAVDIGAWLERGLDLFDRRRSVPFGSANTFKVKCEQEFRADWQSGNAARALAVTEAVLREIEELAQGGNLALRSGYEMKDLFEWVFSTDHISLVYGLSHRGVALRKLSPGTKGIVLLMVYLSMNRKDTTPLVIDQPEENLDNESIYGHLVRYFREAKRRRQVFLITHNPNLVVNTDADQVIVARNERQEDGRPALSYHSGSLENSDRPGAGIREQVCKILEGGEEAFRKREKRYLFT